MLGTPDPALASEIIKGYLLPMFEAEMQVRTDVARSSGFGTSRLRGLEAVPGTVFGEMKLSDQLSREVVRLRSELKTAKSALKDAEQRVASALSEAKLYQVRTLELQESLKMLHLHYSQEVKSGYQHELTEMKLDSELRTIMESYAGMEEECKAKNALLQDQYALIDKLKTKETSQDHMAALLQMQNDIIGERLKGLYSSIQSAIDNHQMEQSFSNELLGLSQRQKELADFLEKVVIRLDQVTMEKEKLADKCSQLITFRNEMKAERDRIARVAKEQIQILQVQLQKREEEKEKLTAESSKVEQKFKDLTDEYEKLRLKAKQNRLKRKMYGEEDEKVCKNCQRVFIESENYNWSCRRHQSEYSGEIYWCCGKAGKDTPGCKISRHETKEEDEEGDEVGKIDRNPSSLYCSSCKKLGHTATDCPRDPNIRSTFDLGDEIHRVTDIIASKKKEDQFSSTVALELMTQRSELYQFNNPEADSSGSESDSGESEEDSSARAKAFFQDIARIKRSVIFDKEGVRIRVD
jgi:hypothetical protein